MHKSSFSRFTRLFQTLYRNYKSFPRSETYGKAFSFSLLKPRTLIIFPALRLSMLHEKDQGNLFLNLEGKVKLNKIIDKADKLYNEKEQDELVALLMKYRDTEHPEILWRLARVLYEKALKNGDDRIKKNLIMKALELTQKAVDIDAENYACHKWYAFILDGLLEFEGIEERRSQATVVKDHLLVYSTFLCGVKPCETCFLRNQNHNLRRACTIKAIEINDQDPMLYYAMGRWCFEHAEISWFERSFSSILFHSSPESTFQEALGFFMKAEKMQFGLSSENYLMIAKTHLKLCNKNKAKKYLLKAMNFSSTDTESKKIFDEAVKLMKTNKLDEI